MNPQILLSSILPGSVTHIKKGLLSFFLLVAHALIQCRWKPTFSPLTFIVQLFGYALFRFSLDIFCYANLFKIKHIWNMKKLGWPLWALSFPWSLTWGVLLMPVWGLECDLRAGKRPEVILKSFPALQRKKLNRDWGAKEEPTGRSSQKVASFSQERGHSLGIIHKPQRNERMHRESTSEPKVLFTMLPAFT